jgi:hypothetical protein
MNVIPAKAGIQKHQRITKALDPGFRRGDDFYEFVTVGYRMETI